MNTLAIQHQLSELLVPLGIAGAVLAALASVVACVMTATGIDEIGLPVAAWMAGTLLSLAAGFSDLRPALFAVATGAAMAALIPLVLTARHSLRRKAKRGHG